MKTFDEALLTVIAREHVEDKFQAHVHATFQQVFNTGLLVGIEMEKK